MIRKTELVEMTHKKLNEGKHGYYERTTQEEVKEVIDTFFDVIEQSLLDGEDVMLTGIGKFSNKITKERVGRNPQTGEEIIVAPRRVIKCKVAKSLNDAIREVK